MESGQLDDLVHKCMEQVESIFENLPKPLKWRSFLNNDLSLLTDISLPVQHASVKHSLNKLQTKALARLETDSRHDQTDPDSGKTRYSLQKRMMRKFQLDFVSLLQELSSIDECQDKILNRRYV